MIPYGTPLCQFPDIKPIDHSHGTAPPHERSRRASGSGYGVNRTS
jgi:hypothetical protein